MNFSLRVPFVPPRFCTTGLYSRSKCKNKPRTSKTKKDSSGSHEAMRLKACGLAPSEASRITCGKKEPKVPRPQAYTTPKPRGLGPRICILN